MNIYRNSFPIILFNNPIAIVSGGFDPIHSGHIHYIKEAKRIIGGSGFVFVGLNSNEWLKRKKGRYFMPFEERATILNNLIDVDSVVSFDDSDNSAINLIKKVRLMYPTHELFFCNGGDRDKTNIPEMLDEDLVKDDNLRFEFGVGGSTKQNSSSWILEEYKAPKTERPWGYYRVLHEVGPGIKLKELTVNPGESLSMQRHFHRNEFWFVAQGVATLHSCTDTKHFVEHEYIFINKEEWHQLCNKHESPLKVIEIQYGDKCIEEDIERKQILSST